MKGVPSLIHHSKKNIYKNKVYMIKFYPKPKNYLQTKTRMKNHLITLTHATKNETFTR